jgi:hypothetical protein
MIFDPADSDCENEELLRNITSSLPRSCGMLRWKSSADLLVMNSRPEHHKQYKDDCFSAVEWYSH